MSPVECNLAVLASISGVMEWTRQKGWLFTGSKNTCEMNIECRTCFYFSQESGESCWPGARKLSHLQFTHGIFQGCGGGAKGSTCGKRRKWPAQKLSQTVNDFPLPFVKTGPKSYHRKTLKKWVLVNRLDWCDWWVRMPSIELTDVTLVSEHSF